MSTNEKNQSSMDSLENELQSYGVFVKSGIADDTKVETGLNEEEEYLLEDSKSYSLESDLADFNLDSSNIENKQKIETESIRGDITEETNRIQSFVDLDSSMEDNSNIVPSFDIVTDKSNELSYEDGKTDSVILTDDSASIEESQSGSSIITDSPSSLSEIELSDRIDLPTEEKVTEMSNKDEDPIDSIDDAFFESDDNSPFNEDLDLSLDKFEPTTSSTTSDNVANFIDDETNLLLGDSEFDNIIDATNQNQKESDTLHSDIIEGSNENNTVQSVSEDASSVQDLPDMNDIEFQTDMIVEDEPVVSVISEDQAHIDTADINNLDDEPEVPLISEEEDIQGSIDIADVVSVDDEIAVISEEEDIQGSIDIADVVSVDDEIVMPVISEEENIQGNIADVVSADDEIAVISEEEDIQESIDIADVVSADDEIAVISEEEDIQGSIADVVSADDEIAVISEEEDIQGSITDVVSADDEVAVISEEEDIQGSIDIADVVSADDEVAVISEEEDIQESIADVVSVDDEIAVISEEEDIQGSIDIADVVSADDEVTTPITSEDQEPIHLTNIDNEVTITELDELENIQDTSDEPIPPFNDSPMDTSSDSDNFISINDQPDSTYLNGLSELDDSPASDEDLLKSIETELSSIKNELHSLKKELQLIRSSDNSTTGSEDSTEINEQIEFLSDVGDQYDVSLTEDELDNILTTADNISQPSLEISSVSSIGNNNVPSIEDDLVDIENLDDDASFDIPDSIPLSDESDLVESIMEEPIIDNFEDIVPESESVPDISEEIVPQDLKQGLKDVLHYMDSLFDSLPAKKIEEFAKSEHYHTYKRLFEELGL